MNIVLSNKILVLISSFSLAAGVLALKFGYEGLFPLFVVVISFFSVVINLYLLCISREEKDVSDSYQ